ncbi:MAG TPA: alpha/beta hydrolase [Acidimicrobiales bacterium]|nr:alpha/beta hydrolase [Acidimicrobiales bacterium]
MSYFESFDGIKLYFEEQGVGPPVVLLHGLSASIDLNWRQPGIWKAVLDTGKRVIGVDARGHGRSDKPHDLAAYQDYAMVRDVRALFDHLALDRADVVGYSMGAATALRFAANEPRLGRLVLGGIGGDPARWAAADGRDSARARGRRMLAGLEADDPSTLDDKLARRARRLMEARGNDLKAMAAILRAGPPLDATFDPATVTATTLVVCGDNDVSPEPLAAALPNATALVLEGDHEGVVTNSALAVAIADFVAA